jgi:nucleotide-binding universal stress UspA family protein
MATDLIVVGAHGRTALGRFFFGSVSQQIVNEARCSVRVARGRIVTPADTPASLVVGVDGSAGAAAAVEEIARRHWPFGAEVRFVNAAWMIPPVARAETVVYALEWVAQENEPVTKLLDEVAEKLRAAGLQVSTVVKEEEPKRLLCAEAESMKADCIFVGVGRLERILTGSISAGVAARADCSVELVRER